MGMLKITDCTGQHFTCVDNAFIDSYMAKANGEYVKVYLLLLRRMESSSPFSVSEFAEILDNTEGDIIRALKYWAKKGLLTIEYGPDGEMCGLQMDAPQKSDAAKKADAPSASVDIPVPDSQVAAPASVPEDTPVPAVDSPVDSAPATPPIGDISEYKSRREFKQLLFIAEQYIGRTLSPSDVETLTYFYDTLQFSVELTEYLIEYCVENGHRSMHYIKSVALAWADAGIRTVSEARRSASFYNKDCTAVLKAFGITGRMAAPVETELVKKWTGQYGFTIDIIVEACSRTVSAIHQPSFEYADKILTNWHQKGVHHLADIAAIDAAYIKKRSEKSASQPAPASEKKTKFSNFEERDYNMDDLERQLLQS